VNLLNEPFLSLFYTRLSTHLLMENLTNRLDPPSSMAFRALTGVLSINPRVARVRVKNQRKSVK